MHFKKVLLGMLASLSCLAQNIPAITAKALDGSAVVFPKSADKKPLLVIVGFSHKSSEDFKAWNQRVLLPYLNQPRIDYWLISTECFVRAMILHGMRREVPKAQHSHFAPITAGGALHSRRGAHLLPDPIAWGFQYKGETDTELQAS